MILGALVILGTSYVAYLGLAPLEAHEVPEMNVTIESTPERVARGKKLVSILCATCHYNSEDAALSGKLAPYPANMGVFYSENLTRHPAAGIGAWTDGELLYFLRTTIGPDGRQRFMGAERHMADEDIASIIAFLKSDDPWVRPVDRSYPAAEPSFFGRIIVKTLLTDPSLPEAPIPVPDPDDKIALGRYVAIAVGACFGCHSGESVMDINIAEPEKSTGYMSGGRVEETPWGTEVYMPNITFDVETGIGAYTLTDFTRVLREGLRPDGTALEQPMPMFPELSDVEVEALYVYLKSIPPVRRPPVVLPPPTPGENATEGELSYYRYKCYACHGESGTSSCDLRAANHRYPDDERIAAWIRDPAAFMENAKMPTWDGVIPDSEYPGLVAYVRELGRRWEASLPPGTEIPPFKGVPPSTTPPP